MDDTELRLAALFDDAPIADDGFTERVIALCALEDRLARGRRAGMTRLGLEAAALAGVLAAFAGLASVGTASDVVPLASPAMIGLLLLGTWLAVGPRAAATR